MMRLAWRTLLGCALIAAFFWLLSGCGHGGAGSDSDETSAPPASAIVMAVSGAKVTVTPMSSRIRLLGTTVAQRHLTLRAPAAGRIEGFNLQNGDTVRRGQVVARVINREIEAAESGLVVARHLDPGESTALAASLKRNSSSPAIAVTTPEDAIVAQRTVSSGQIVADLDPLADLLDPRSVYVEAAVPIADLANVRSGMAAVVTSPLQPGVRFEARVAAASPSFSPGGATAPVRIEFTGHDRITQAGAPAEIFVTTSDLPAAIVIPDVALFDDASASAHYIFVAGTDGRAHRTMVTVGVHDGTQTQIIAGLAPGAIVITSGGYALSDGLRVKVAVANQ
jgi:multidrug efflux pump subunit AcrA (membrane-fusion protein)